MQISKFKKKNKEQYEVFLENGEKLLIYEEVIIKNNLLVNKNINEKMLETINRENNAEGIYSKCIKYISTRIRSEKEIRDYLEKKEYDIELINKTIDKLKKNKLINNEVFVEAFINDKLLLTNYGPLKIKNELTKHKIEASIINKYLDKIDKNIYDGKIDKIINKYVKNNKKYSNNMLKNKIQTHLVDLGYPKEMYMYKLENINVCNTDEILKKEFEKELKKLSRKYSDNELKLKLKQKMYQKGFNISKIDKFIDEYYL